MKSACCTTICIKNRFFLSYYYLAKAKINTYFSSARPGRDFKPRNATRKLYIMKQYYEIRNGKAPHV